MRRLPGVMAYLCLVGSGLVWGIAAANEREEPLILTLGDSVPFGMINQDGYAYVNSDNFQGYPDYLAEMLHFRVVNAACPGEATTGFLAATGADFGCRPYKDLFPLHVAYHGAATQLEFALALVRTHGYAVRLITIGLGANDGFLLQDSCSDDPACVAAGLPGLMLKVSTNLQTIMADLRAAGFTGPIAIVNYYSPDYTDPELTGRISSINTAINEAATASGAVVADVFSAFHAAAAAVGGKTCQAGLLNVDPNQSATLKAPCDFHPSLSGHRLIAKTVARSLR